MVGGGTDEESTESASDKGIKRRIEQISGDSDSSDRNHRVCIRFPCGGWQYADSIQ